ncbi:MAG TPA: hypothetical protein VKG62_05505, partial [Solirubrobacteraceae bacterium]|nr:hypothetical protein [Solirubrobacteraceae bacterium]
MRWSRYMIPLVAVLAWVIVAIVLGTGSPSGAHTVVGPSGPSPACLPSSLNHSASLSGTNLDVSPEPGTDTANPDTQISFLGTPVTNIRDVSVHGSSSGSHSGQLEGYYQGDGGSFVPEKPFVDGEQVSVRASVLQPGGERVVSYSFHVATPFSTASVPGFPDPAAPPSAYQSFSSEPSIQPPILSVTSPDLDPTAGDVLITTGPGPGQYGPLIYTPQGRLVWFDELPPGVNALDLNMQSYEGQQDLTWWQGRVVSLGFGYGEDLVVDHNYQTVATIRA